MALMEWKASILSTVRQYKYVVIIAVVGIVMLLFPTGAKSDPQVISEAQENILTVEEHLAAVLSLVKGAGRVEVFLSQEFGEEILYQTDEDNSSTGNGYDTRKDTVTISGVNREEKGLIRQINPPTYKGAIIVCQGADDPVVRLMIVEAVSRVTGLGASKISVLRMG